MSTNVGSIHYDLDLDTKKFDNAVNGLQSKLKSVGSSMQNMGKNMSLFVTAPVVAGFGSAIKAASDFNETINKVEVAFKDQAQSVKDWSKTSLKGMGLAKASALEAASLFGDMSTAMGLSTKDASKMSMSLVQLGADLASFKNIPFEQAQTALAGVFTGETESLKRLGIIMTETNLLEFAKAQGIQKTVQEMTQAEKVQLRYAYVMSVTKNAQGDFNRTSDGTANQMRMTSERVKEMSAEIGQKLLPVAGQLLGWANKILSKFQALSPEQQTLILKIAAFAAVIGPLIWILGTLATSISAIITVVGAMGTAISVVGSAFTGFAALIATPLVMPAIAVAAALASIMLVYNAIKSVMQALDDLEAARQSKTSLDRSLAQNRKEMEALAKNGTPAQQARAKKYLAAPGFARGTMYAPGGMSLVGERGPELVNLPRGSQVHTNQESKKMMGSSNTTVFNIGTVKSNSDENYIFRRLDRQFERSAMGVSI